MQTYIKDIQNHQLFSGISENNLSAMLVCLGGYTKSYKKGEIIFLSEELLGNVISTSAWEDKVNGIYLSDHYPVCAELKLTTNE